MSTFHTSPHMKVGELARKTGKSVRAIRLYEEMGLLTPESRSKGGFRLYGADQVARVYWIAKLQDMGFGLAQIRELLAAVESSSSGPDAMQSVREMFRARLQHTREQVAKLLELERDLSESLAYLEGCRACSDPVAPDACASCDTDHADRHDTPAPSLVAGLHVQTDINLSKPPSDGGEVVQ